MKHILFITSTNLASNPRCRKEAELALAEGYKVSVIAFKLPNWTWEKELLIQQELKDIDFYYLPADRSSYKLWLESVGYEKAGRWLFRAGMRNMRTLGAGVNRRAIPIKKLLKRHAIHPDIIVAHNPGAFWPAICQLKGNIRVGIDVEDYHPGEGTDPILSNMQAVLLQKILPRASYVSYASLPIMEQVKTILPATDHKQHLVINNLFPGQDFPKPSTEISAEALQLVWFSQNIDAGRGLEQLLPVLDQFADQLHVTLIGNSQTDFCRRFIRHRSYVSVIDSMEQTQLHRQIGQYDIGLAIEPGKDLNNTLALSNKLCAYFQAGLYIIATATRGQQTFMESFPGHGTVVDLKMENLAGTLRDLLQNVREIRKDKVDRWTIAQEHSWENENKKLRLAWSSLMQ